MRSTRTPRARALRTTSLLAAILATGALVLLAGCATTKPKKRARPMTEKSPVKTMEDVKHATFSVMWNAAGSNRMAPYKISYMMRAGKASLLEVDASAFPSDDAATAGAAATVGARRLDRIQNYLLMGPIVAIVGESREFTVGQAYDGLMLRPDGRPHFRYTCDAEETIGGVKGFHLTIVGVKEKKPEMEVILSPGFSFPLYIKEFNGEDPLEITLQSKD